MASRIQVRKDRTTENPYLGRYCTVAWVKTNWADPAEDWQWADWLTPVGLQMSDFHGRSQATFLYNYGEIQRKGATTPVQSYPRPDRNLYVTIMVQPLPPLLAFCLWCGVIPAEQLRIGGSREDSSTGEKLPAGVQTLTARGFEFLLERRGLDGAAVVAPGQEEEEETDWQFIRRVPTFNERLPRGGQRGGNRSQYPINYTGPGITRPATYGFGSDLNGNEPYRWSARDIINYVLTWTDEYDDAEGDPLTDEPHFILGGSFPFALWSVLGGIYPTVRAERRNAWEILKEVIDRRQGLGASFAWSLDGDGWPDGSQPIEIRLHSLVGEPINVGGATLPANPRRIDLVIDEARDIDTATVSISAVSAYDRIVVQGEPVRSCFTAAVHQPIPEPPEDPPDPPGLAGERNLAACTPAWPTADQTAYEAADDAQRRRERYNRVFRMFRLGHADDAQFDWQTKGIEPHQLNPAIDDNGQVQIDSPGPFGNLEGRLLGELPISEPSDVAGEVSQQRFMKPFALCELLDEDGAPTGSWVTAHAPPEPGAGDAEDEGVDRPDVSADVSVQDRGFEFDVHFRQGNHVLGRNHFTPGEEVYPTQEAVFDYFWMLVTVCAETDNRPTVIVDTGVSDHFRSRTKVIQIPDAHLWLVAPGTVIGINDDGTPTIYAGEQIARDDTGLLRQVAAMASAYYGRERASLELTRKGLRLDYELGMFLTSVLVNQQYQDVGAPLAALEFNFKEQTTTIRTGHFELDFWGR